MSIESHKSEWQPPVSVGKIERLKDCVLIKDVLRESYSMKDKINELVDAVNELRDKVCTA